MSTKWEYLYTTLMNDSDVTEELNKRGANGWEVINLDKSVMGRTTFLLIREIEEEPVEDAYTTWAKAYGQAARDLARAHGEFDPDWAGWSKSLRDQQLSKQPPPDPEPEETSYERRRPRNVFERPGLLINTLFYWVCTTPSCPTFKFSAAKAVTAVHNTEVSIVPCPECRSYSYKLYP